MDVTEIIWRPDPAAAARTRMGRFMAQHGLATLEDLQRRSIAEPEWYWDAVSRDLGLHWFTPYRRVLDESQGIPWPRWFEGGRLNLADNCVDRHIAEGRGGKPAVIAEAEDGTVRTLTYAELAGEINRLANALKRLGIRPGRHGRDLPAHVRRGGDRHARGGAHRRGVHAVLLRLRRAGGGLAARRLRRAPAHHRGRLRAPRPGDPAQAHRGRGGERLAHRGARDRVPPRRRRRAVEGRPRPLVARAGGQGVHGVPRAAGRGRSSVPDHLHVGHHRPAQGHRAHPRRLLDQERARLRLSLRPGRERPALLGDRSGLAHGADADRRRPAHRRHRGALRGHARLSEAGPALVRAGAPPRHRARHLAHRGARAHAPRRRVGHAPRSLVAQADGLDRRAVEPRALSLALRDRGEGQAADHQLHGRHRDLGRHPLVLPDRARSSRARSRGRFPAWPPTSTTTTAGRCAGRWASWSSRGRGRA